MIENNRITDASITEDKRKLEIEYIQKQLFELNNRYIDSPDNNELLKTITLLTEELNILQGKKPDIDNEFKNNQVPNLKQVIAPLPETNGIVILNPYELKILKTCLNDIQRVYSYIEDDQRGFDCLKLRTNIETQLFSQNKNL